MSDPLTVALDELEATLAAVYAQADADYLARQFPWHDKTVDCADRYPDHTHGPNRIIYYPDPVSVGRPIPEEPT